MDITLIKGLEMPIVEDDVKNAMKAWLESRGYLSIDVKLGTRQGYDVEGMNPFTNKRLVIECKGEAKTGDQHGRSWGNVASALLTSLNEAEAPTNTNDVGIAFPDTKDYRGRMALLQNFCHKQNIAIFWVSESGSVLQW